MKKFNPKVSIIIPVYNGEDYLSCAIDSALNQTYDNLEVIVVNDGSVDSSEEVAKGYGNKINYIYKENGGVASALNVGIKAAKGEYISWLSHDDLYYPDKVLKQIEFLSKEKNKEIIVASNVELVDSDLNLIEVHKLSKKLVKYPLSYLTFDVTTGLNGCALLMSKKLFERNGYFDLNLRTTQDYDMWSRFAINEKFAILDDVLVKSRQHPNQGSKTIKCVHKEVDELHSRFISMISDKEFSLYFDNDICKMLEITTLYKNAMLSWKSAVEMFFKIYKIYGDKNKKMLLDYFNKNFLMADGNDFKEKRENKKRVLFYNNIWIRGGIERVLSNIFESLKDTYDIYFATCDIDKDNSYEIPSEVTVINVGKNLNEFLPYSILSLCKMYNIDLFIGTQNLNIHVLNIYKLLKEYDIKTIASNHYSYYLPVEIGWLNEVVGVRDDCYDAATAVVWANSTSAKLYGITHSNTYHIANPNSFDVLDKPKENTKNIMCVGRFDDLLKRLELTLEAFSKAYKKDSSLKLTVVGKYDEKARIMSTGQTFKDFIKSLNLPESAIEFVGETTEVEKYYRDADLLLLTSQSEGFGMVVTEAATFGVPTIAFDIVGLSDIIHDGINGYLVDCYDTSLMAEKINKYFSSSSDMTLMKKNTLKEVKSFDKKIIINEWNKLIDSILGNVFSSNVDIDLSQKDLIRIFDKTFLNVSSPFNNAEEKKFILFRMVDKVKYQYRTYGIKKTIKEIVIYPVKITRRMFGGKN